MDFSDVNALNAAAGFVVPTGPHYHEVPWYQQLLGCTACPARQEARRVVPGAGPLSAEICVIGQNPGVDEDEKGVPFIGKGGEEMSAWLRLLGLDRQKVLVTNIVKCFPGDTRVDARGIERIYRRWYEGELITVTTAHGQLSGTPNHPVLTPRGWVPLGALQQGDDLIRGSFGERPSLSDPDVHGGPPTLEELFNASRLLAVGERVIGSDVDFHGDGREAEVEVVTLDRLLGDWLKPALLQHRLQLALERADDTPGRLESSRSRMRELLAVGDSLLATARSGVSPTNQSVALLTRHPLPAVVQSRRVAADLDATGYKPGLQRPLVEAESPFEGSETLPAHVGRAEIVKVERREFSGHIYTLQTKGRQYTAEGYIVHNCHTEGNRAPRPKEIETCESLWWKRELETFTNLVVVIPLGRPALTGLVGKIGTLPDVMSASWFKTVFEGSVPPRELHVLPLAHPAFLLRNAQQRPVMYEKVLPVVRDYLRREVPDVYQRAAL